MELKELKAKTNSFCSWGRWRDILSHGRFKRRMTERDVENYKNSVKEHGASFDKNEIVGDTFRQTEILITDYSSIILEFFLSGKPVIYCGKK